MSWAIDGAAMLSLLDQAAAVDVVLVSVFLPWMMAELKPRAKPARGEERIAHAGSQRDHHLHSRAFDSSKSLHSGIVGDAHRLLPPLLKLSLHCNVDPRGAQLK